jgi:hypothetical protein
MQVGQPAKGLVSEIRLPLLSYEKIQIGQPAKGLASERLPASEAKMQVGQSERDADAIPAPKSKTRQRLNRTGFIQSQVYLPHK